MPLSLTTKLNMSLSDIIKYTNNLSLEEKMNMSLDDIIKHRLEYDEDYRKEYEDELNKELEEYFAKNPRPRPARPSLLNLELIKELEEKEKEYNSESESEDDMERFAGKLIVENMKLKGNNRMLIILLIMMVAITIGYNLAIFILINPLDYRNRNVNFSEYVMYYDEL